MKPDRWRQHGWYAVARVTRLRWLRRRAAFLGRRAGGFRSAFLTRLRLLDDCMAKTRNGIVRDADTRLLEDLRDGAERSVLGAQASDAVFVRHERPKSCG